MATPTAISFPSISSSISTVTAHASCFTLTPGRYGYVPPKACNAQWAYSPSFAAAIAFTVLFSLTTLAHLALAITHRKPFCWVIIMGSTLGAHDQQKEAYVIGSTLLFLLAPLWINAFVYMAVGRLMYTYHPEKKVWGFKAVSLGKYFVWLDIISFIVQVVGGIMVIPGSSPQTANIGKDVYMSGIALQQFFILLFLALFVRFHLDTLEAERAGALPTSNGTSWWKVVAYGLYAVLACITTRIAFRLAEYSSGMNPSKNMLPYKEGYPLGLDAAPMLLALVILAVVHPGLALNGPESEFLSRKETRAERKEEREAKKTEVEMPVKKYEELQV